MKRYIFHAGYQPNQASDSFARARGINTAWAIHHAAFVVHVPLSTGQTIAFNDIEGSPISLSV